MQEDLDIVVLMETKRSSFCQRRIGSIWRSRRVEWESLDSIGSSGGLLMMWKSCFHVVHEVIRGSFSLTLVFLDSSRKDFSLTRVYGPPRI